MKLYQRPDGNIVTYKTSKEIGDTDDGWVVNDGTMPPKDALVEIIMRDGKKARPLVADGYYWQHEDQTGDIMAYRIIGAPKPKTFSTIAKGDTVTVSLTVTKVDIRHGTTMFSTDCPEWFEAHDAIGYVAPLRTPIEAGQVRQCLNVGSHYLVLATPADDDVVVAVRFRNSNAQPFMKDRTELDATMVITP